MRWASGSRSHAVRYRDWRSLGSIWAGRLLATRSKTSWRGSRPADVMVDDDGLDLAGLSAGPRRPDGASRAHQSSTDAMLVRPTIHRFETKQPSPDVGSGEFWGVSSSKTKSLLDVGKRSLDLRIRRGVLTPPGPTRLAYEGR